MNTSTAVAGTAIIAAAGRWANNEPLDIKFAINVGFFAIAMSVLSAVNDEISGLIGLLVLFGVGFKYLPPILAKMGLSR